MPLVSIVIPTHNRPQMLAEALASVRTQTFTDYEIIVVSNGESPEMRQAGREVVADHYCRYGARECAYLELSEGNVSAARNAGIERAKGEWIAFLDDDDIWLPTKLARQLDEAERTGADMISCDYVEFDDHGAKPDRVLHPSKWHSPDVKTLSHMLWWAAPSAVIVRAEVVRRVQFDPSFPNNEDTDLWRRISWRHRIHQTDVVLTRMRRAHPSLTRNRIKAFRYEIFYFRKTFRDTPSDLRWALPTKQIMVRRLTSSAVRIFLTDMWTGIPAFQALHRQWARIRGTPRLRTRLIAFRYWLGSRLRPRTRLIQFSEWLRGPHHRLRPRTRLLQLYQRINDVRFF